MKIRYSVDRAEGDIAVCISDDDQKFEVPIALMGEMEPRDVFSAIVDGDGLTDIVPMPEERDRRIEKNRARLHRLAKRSQK